jgi:predicted Zn finger-like uncharacterized protein
MTVNCPECKSIFRVDPAKVPATGVRARCSVCGGIMAIAGGTLPVSVTPTSAAVAVPTFGGGASRATPRLPATSAPAMVTPMSSTASVHMPTPTPAASPSYSPPLRRTPAFATPAIATPAVPTPAIAASAVGAAVDTAMESETPAPSSMTAAYSTPTTVTPPLGSRSMSGTPSASKRPINPFLRADPSQRARRLARALVSDLVAYHPQKREEGLRDGTLRQLFREEIKKSYEEYVEQVGRDVAEGSSHFQEALNDILAGGRRLF